MVRSQEQLFVVWHSLNILVYATSLMQHKTKHSEFHCYRRNTATVYHTALIPLSICITVGIYCVFWTPTLCCHITDQDAFQAIPLEALKRHPLDRCAHSLVKYFLPAFKGILSYQGTQLQITRHSNDWRYSSKEYLTQTNVITAKWLNFWTQWKQNCVHVPWKCTVWIKLAISNQSLRKHIILEYRRKSKMVRFPILQKPKSWMLRCSSFDINQP